MISPESRNERKLEKCFTTKLPSELWSSHSRMYPQFKRLLRYTTICVNSQNKNEQELAGDNLCGLYIS